MSRSFWPNKLPAEGRRQINMQPPCFSARYVCTSQQLPSDPLYGNRRWLVLTTIMTKKEHLSLYRETTRKQRQWIWYKDDTTKQNSAPWCFCSRRNAWNHSKKTIDRKNITLHFHQESFFQTIEYSLFAGHNSSRLWADYPAGQIQFPISWARQPVIRNNEL